MIILGISAFYHDSAAAILVKGKIIAAAQEERFTRIKHDPSFPSQAIKFTLAQAQVTISDIDAIAFYDKPFLKFERLLETYLSFAPKGLVSFIKSMPVWLKEKLFIKQTLRKELKKIGKYDKQKLKILFPEHHLSHAASAYYQSGFNEAAILTVDGVGEWATASIGKGSGGLITIHKQLEFPHSVGLLYSSFTYYCGFKVNSGEYKLMGLAPYGNESAAKKYADTIRNNLVKISEDGSIFLHQQYFKYATGLRMADDNKWEKLFGFKRRKPESDISQSYSDLALAIQIVLEEIILKMTAEAKRVTGAVNLCMAGGIALNCVANSVLLSSGLFQEIFVQPAAGDAGGAIGAAFAAYHIYYEQPFYENKLTNVYYGPEDTDTQITSLINKYSAAGEYLENEELMKFTADQLNKNKIIGWCQGRMEFGPRSLGNRSILASPTDPGMQKLLNLKIKFREDFRPFAPVVPEEDMNEYFECRVPSPFMLFVFQVRERWRDKLPAITHKDDSARVQTVSLNNNGRLHSLLQAFKKKSGISVLINTSFNVRGEPIVNNCEDAYRCFMTTGIDYLVLGNYVFDKTAQPAWSGSKPTFGND